MSGYLHHIPAKNTTQDIYAPVTVRIRSSGGRCLGDKCRIFSPVCLNSPLFLWCAVEMGLDVVIEPITEGSGSVRFGFGSIRTSSAQSTTEFGESRVTSAST